MKGISSFDSQKSLIGNFLVEIEGEKLTNESAKKSFNKTPPVKDLDINQHRKSENFDKNNTLKTESQNLQVHNDNNKNDDETMMTVTTTVDYCRLLLICHCLLIQNLLSDLPKNLSILDEL